MDWKANFSVSDKDIGPLLWGIRVPVVLLKDSVCGCLGIKLYSGKEELLSVLRNIDFNDLSIN